MVITEIDQLRKGKPMTGVWFFEVAEAPIFPTLNQSHFDAGDPASFFLRLIDELPHTFLIQSRKDFWR